MKRKPAPKPIPYPPSAGFCPATLDSPDDCECPECTAARATSVSRAEKHADELAKREQDNPKQRRLV